MNSCEMELACELEYHCSQYTWLIKDFRREKSKGTIKYSASVGEFYEIKKTAFKSHRGNYVWFLNLYGVGSSEEWEDDSYSIDEFHIEVLCKRFSTIFHEKNIEIMIDSGDINYKVNNVKGYLNSKENRKNIMLFTSEQSEGLVNDKGDLTIVFRIIEPFSSVVHTSEMQKLTCDFEKLLKTGVYSDFKIIIGKREFLVHKNVLSARSDYFAALIKHDTKERDSNEVEIFDVRFEVMSELLQYIYCGVVNITEDLMYDLLTAADMYQIEGLPEKCKEFIIVHVKTSNVGECIVYAERYNNDHLFEAGTDFAVKHASEFSKAKQNLLKSNLTTIMTPSAVNFLCKALFNTNK